MKNKEQIREEIRKVLNQILDEEFISIINETLEDKTRRVSQSLTQTLEGLTLKQNNLNEGKENGAKDSTQEPR